MNLQPLTSQHLIWHYTISSGLSFWMFKINTVCRCTQPLAVLGGGFELLSLCFVLFSFYIFTAMFWSCVSLALFIFACLLQPFFPGIFYAPVWNYCLLLLLHVTVHYVTLDLIQNTLSCNNCLEISRLEWGFNLQSQNDSN